MVNGETTHASSLAWEEIFLSPIFFLSFRLFGLRLDRAKLFLCPLRLTYGGREEVCSPRDALPAGQPDKAGLRPTFRLSSGSRLNLNWVAIARC